MANKVLSIKMGSAYGHIVYMVMVNKAYLNINSPSVFRPKRQTRLGLLCRTPLRSYSLSLDYPYP